MRQSGRSRLPFASLPLGLIDFLHPAELPPQQTVTLDLRVRSTSYFTAQAKPELRVPEARRKAAQKERNR